MGWVSDRVGGHSGWSHLSLTAYQAMLSSLRRQSLVHHSTTLSAHTTHPSTQQLASSSAAVQPLHFLPTPACSSILVRPLTMRRTPSLRLSSPSSSSSLSCWLLVLSLLCCACLSHCFVVITDGSGQSFTFEQSTPSSSFPDFSIPALTAVNFTVSVSADIGYVDIHVAVPGSTTDNSTYNCQCAHHPTARPHCTLTSAVILTFTARVCLCVLRCQTWPI